MNIPNVLTIAGSDSSGGAGIQADLKAFSALGAYGASVITALTAQNTRGVTGIHDVPPGFVTLQIDAVFDDLDIAAVKIGMLSQVPIIEAVADALARTVGHQRARGGAQVAIVLDPVMVAKSGAQLLQPNAIEALKSRLLPLATVVTPNLPEAAVLIGHDVGDSDDGRVAAAQELLACGPKAVLLKGGHGSGAQSVDHLVDAQSVQRYAADRVETKNTHGTGCTLSSAIAALMGHGLPLADAVRDAKRYLTEALAHADVLNVGAGHGPVHHFHALWRHVSPGR